LAKQPLRKLDVLFRLYDYGVAQEQVDFARYAKFLPPSAPVVAEYLPNAEIVGGIAVIRIGSKLFCIAILNKNCRPFPIECVA